MPACPFCDLPLDPSGRSCHGCRRPVRLAVAGLYLLALLPLVGAAAGGAVAIRYGVPWAGSGPGLAAGAALAGLLALPAFPHLPPVWRRWQQSARLPLVPHSVVRACLWAALGATVGAGTGAVVGLATRGLDLGAVGAGAVRGGTWGAAGLAALAAAGSAAGRLARDWAGAFRGPPPEAVLAPDPEPVPPSAWA